MSSLVKQRRLTSKAIVSIAIAVISVLAIAVGALTIFALNQVNFNSSVKISYQAKDIAGKVTMYAKAAPKASNYTAKVDSEKIGEFEFTPTTDTTENPAEINMDDVELDSTDNALYLHYYFENDGTRAYTAVLNYALTDIITNQNMTLEYSESGAEGSYKNANSGLVVPGKGTKDYFVKISVTDLAFNADFEGMFTWQLNECDDSLTAMEEISLTATEFTVISEEDNTYSAKYNGGDISIKGEVTGQANTIDNLWYVPGNIGSGKVVSVVQGEMSYTSIPAVPKYPLPANTKVVIAESVKTLGVSAFFNHKGLKEIEIPNSITQISGSVFEGCEGLMNVILHNNITNIGDLAFCCSGLTSIIIPNSVTEIGNHAFAGCVNLVSIILPSGLTAIKDGTLRDCKSLSEIIIPNNVTTIAYAAFQGCESLTSIEIPNSVTSIGLYVFNNCLNLTTINFDANIANFSFGDTFPSLKDATKQVTVNLGNNVTSISAAAFAVCRGMTEITIPNSVTSLGSMAFDSCTSLTNMEIPNSINRIESGVFHNCISLTRVEIPDSVTSIGNNAFDKCASLTSVEIPNSVTRIEACAFDNCVSLTNVIFEDPNDWYSINHVDIKDDYGNYVSTETVYNEISASVLANPTTAASALVGSNDWGWIKITE